MASMGLLGAVKGGASSFQKFLTDELNNERATALENLRASNTRETNKINNEQRNDFTLNQMEIEAKNKREQEEFRQAGAFAQDAVNRAYDTQDPTKLEQEFGFLTKSIKDGGVGMTIEEAQSFLAPRGGQMSRQEFRADIIGRLSDSELLSEDEIIARADRFTTEVYKDQPAAAPSAGDGPTPFNSNMSEEQSREWLKKNAAGDVSDEMIEAELQKIMSGRASSQTQPSPPPAAAPQQASSPPPAAQQMSPAPPLQSAANPPPQTMLQPDNGGPTTVGSAGPTLAEMSGAQPPDDGMQDERQKAELNRKMSAAKAAGIPLNEIDLPVLEQYLSIIDPNSPDYDEVKSIVEQKTQQMMASR